MEAAAVMAVPSPQLMLALKSLACVLGSPDLNVACSETDPGPGLLSGLRVLNEIPRMVEMRPPSKSAVHKLPSGPVAMPVTPLNEYVVPAAVVVVPVAGSIATTACPL